MRAAIASACAAESLARRLRVAALAAVDLQLLEQQRRCDDRRGHHERGVLRRHAAAHRAEAHQELVAHVAGLAERDEITERARLDAIDEADAHELAPPV